MTDKEERELRIKKKIKLFSRFLKELGLYTRWIEERKKAVGYDKEYIFHVLFNYETLSEIIDLSFTWDDTKNPAIWEQLCCAGERAWETIKDETLESCASDEGIEYFKKHLKKKRLI
jgi:hypothetical protein